MSAFESLRLFLARLCKDLHPKTTQYLALDMYHRDWDRKHLVAHAEVEDLDLGKLRTTLSEAIKDLGSVVVSSSRVNASEERQASLCVQKLSPKAVLPQLASAGAVGYDLSSAGDHVVPARGKLLVPTDLAIALPAGVYGRIAPRSGLALKYGMDVGAGVVDPDYRGNVGVILFNHGSTDFTIKTGDRMAQLILEKCLVAPVLEVTELPKTLRGENGFGSSGVN